MSVTIDTDFGLLELADDDAEKFPIDFFDWLKENNSVYTGFVNIAREGLRRRQQWGAFAVINILRWQTAIREVDSRFKINNNQAPLLARIAMVQFPELRSFFRTRELRGK